MRRKITYATAMKIREMRKNNPKLSAIAIHRILKLPCSASAVHAILSNRTYLQWREAPFNPKQRLDHTSVKAIRNYLKFGKKSEWLALKYGVSNSCIQRIKYGLTWK